MSPSLKSAWYIHINIAVKNYADNIGKRSLRQVYIKIFQHLCRILIGIYNGKFLQNRCSRITYRDNDLTKDLRLARVALPGSYLVLNSRHDGAAPTSGPYTNRQSAPSHAYALILRAVITNQYYTAFVRRITVRHHRQTCPVIRTEGFRQSVRASPRSLKSPEKRRITN